MIDETNARWVIRKHSDSARFILVEVTENTPTFDTLDEAVKALDEKLKEN